MMKSMANVDIGKIIIQLQYETKLHEILLEKILNDIPVDNDVVELIKKEAKQFVNDYHGETFITK